MGQQQRLRLSLPDLPECGAINIEKFADAALGVFDLVVHPVGGQVDKARRDFGQQRLKPEPFLQLRTALPALQGIDKDLAQQAQPGDILFRPGVMLAGVVDDDGSRNPAADGHGDDQCGFDAHGRLRLPVPQGLFRIIFQPADVDMFALLQLLVAPRKQFGEVYLPRYRFQTLAKGGMRDSGKGLGLSGIPAENTDRPGRTPIAASRHGRSRCRPDRKGWP